MARPKHPSSSSSTDDLSIQGTNIPSPPLQFSEKAQRLVDLIKDYTLPRVIKCDNVTCPSKDVLKSNLDISQPLLAYMKRSVRKVCAHSLQFDNDKGDYITVGNGILIPEDYPGWFAVMGAPNNITSGHQRVPYYPKISYLATTRCSHFLIGGTNPVRGVMVQYDERGTKTTKPCQVFPGSVLRKGGLYHEDTPAPKEKKKKKKKKNKGQDLPPREFLKCFDDQERELFLHTHQKGVFYIVSKDDMAVSPQVLQMKDILTRLHFPLVVKLIYGRVPTTPCAFTQVLLLTDSGESHTVVASTLLCYSNINIEIPLETDMKFYAAKDTPGLKGSKAFINALDTCREKGPSYIKDMKGPIKDQGFHGGVRTHKS